MDTPFIGKRQYDFFIYLRILRDEKENNDTWCFNFAADLFM